MLCPLMLRQSRSRATSLRPRSDVSRARPQLVGGMPGSGSNLPPVLIQQSDINVMVARVAGRRSEAQAVLMTQRSRNTGIDVLELGGNTRKKSLAAGNLGYFPQCTIGIRETRAELLVHSR